MLGYVLAGLLAYNACVAAVYVLDKVRAARGGRRVSEHTLLLLALALGAPGALAAMLVARHKTRKAPFRFGVPLLLALQLAAGAYAGWLLRGR